MPNGSHTNSQGSAVKCWYHQHTLYVQGLNRSIGSSKARSTVTQKGSRHTYISSSTTDTGSPSTSKRRATVCVTTKNISERLLDIEYSQYSGSSAGIKKRLITVETSLSRIECCICAPTVGPILRGFAVTHGNQTSIPIRFFTAALYSSMASASITWLDAIIKTPFLNTCTCSARPFRHAATSSGTRPKCLSQSSLVK